MTEQKAIHSRYIDIDFYQIRKFPASKSNCKSIFRVLIGIKALIIIIESKTSGFTDKKSFFIYLAMYTHINAFIHR